MFNIAVAFRTEFKFILSINVAFYASYILIDFIVMILSQAIIILIQNMDFVTLLTSVISSSNFLEIMFNLVAANNKYTYPWPVLTQNEDLFNSTCQEYQTKV